jgi:DNA-binding response OmpR family regulator
MLPEILVVDSDVALVALLLQLLQPSGYAVTVCRRFEDAVVLLKSQEFHAVVTAYHLGAHNGLHVILRARAERPAVLGVVMSPTADPVLSAEASALGAVCLVAPWSDSTELLHLLQAGIQPA